MTKEGEQKVKCIEQYAYSQVDRIGKGFSSTVFKGKDRNSEQTVAVKVIDLHKFSETTMHKLLKSEIDILKSLNHANVLKCKDVFITVNSCYIITQLCQGGDLSSEIKKKGRLRGVEALRVMLQISEAVSHLSSLNIIHRDIKPANILLHEGTIKLADFGFAKYDNPQARKQKYVVGSPLYMSPQALFNSVYGKQNDIWSLGIVFYEILQGRPPWDPKNEKQLKILLSEKKEVFFRISVRDELQNLIKRCLKHDKAQRISIKQILVALKVLMAEMMSENNIVYRETLTKRTQQSTSCVQLNSTAPVSPFPRAVITRPYVPRPLQNLSVGHFHNKQDIKKQLTLKTQAPSPPSKQNLEVQAKHKPEIAEFMSLEQASRHNHYILKAVINYSRLIYKSFARFEGIAIKQYQKLEMQSTLNGLLQYTIKWLKDSISQAEFADKFGIIGFDKFKQTRCFSKTVLVINEYYERYNKYSQKLKRSLQDKKYLAIVSDDKSFSFYEKKLKKFAQEMSVIPNSSSHNIALDFLISITILTQMLSKFSTKHFSQNSHIQDIVETEPFPFESQESQTQLKNKLEALLLEG